jgi:hypothetical protein
MDNLRTGIFIRHRRDRLLDRGTKIYNSPATWPHFTSVVNLKLGRISLPATFHTTHDGGSTGLNYLRNMAGKGPKIVFVAGTGHN